MNDEKNNLSGTAPGEDNENIFEMKRQMRASAERENSASAEKPAGAGTPPKAPRPGGSAPAKRQGQPPARPSQARPVRGASAPGGEPAPAARARKPASQAPRGERQASDALKESVRRPVPKKSVPAPVSPKPQAQPGKALQPAASKSISTNAENNTASSAVKNKEKAPKTNLTKQGAEMMSSAIKALIYMAAVLVVAIFISIIVIRVGNDVFAFVKSDDMIDITIPEDATLGDVAEILEENSIIHYPSVFKLYGSLKKDDGKFIAGSYSVSPSMSYDELRREFKAKPVTGTSWITIPEGTTVDEMIELFLSYGIGTREGYIDVINNYDFDYWFVKDIAPNENRTYRLEGYLFPDTYEFYNNSSEEVVINRLLSRFNEVFVQDYRTKAAELGYTVDQILTIASLIEKEAGNAADYRYVSSVFHNRLKRPAAFPKLESDATVVYAIQLATGKRPDTVKPEDLTFSSPYNTYRNEGLPPGPITNPSASAIRYALYPTESNYYYFISANSGETFFASSYAEHQNNIAKVKAMNTGN